MQFLRGSRDYCQGVQVHLPENSFDNVVFFFNLKLILQFYRGCPMVISKKTIIFKGLRGGPTFSRGWQLFPGGGGGGGGPMANFYRNPYNL